MSGHCDGMKLTGYTKSPDGLFRKVVHFPQASGTRAKVIVRRADGSLFRTEKLNPKPERKRI